MEPSHINIRWKPEGLPSHPKGGEAHVEELSSLRHVYQLATAKHLAIGAPVIVLGHAISPNAVVWFVVATAIFALKRQAEGALSHVLQKVLKLLPAFTNGDSGVVEVLWMRWAQSIPHGLPRSVRWCSAIAPFSYAMPMSYAASHPVIKANQPPIVKEVLS